MGSDWPLVAARAAHLWAVMVLFGSAIVALWIRELRDLRIPGRRLGTALAILVLAASCLWLLRYAQQVSEPDDLEETVWAILTQTSFSWLWVVRLAASVLLVVVALLPCDRGRITGTAACAAILLGVEGWDGHVVGTARLGPLNQAAHLLAAGFWVGSLLPLTILVARRQAVEPGREEIASVLRRYSAVAMAAVLVVATTGIINIWLILGAPPRLASDYGRALTLKIALFGLMLVLAALNRLAFMPRFGSESGHRAVVLLRSSILLEQVLAAAILLDVAWFGLMNPSV
jgi:putative copper resistance protein D